MITAKRAGVFVGTAIVVLTFVSMYATELTRAFVPVVAPTPVTLPRNVDIRYSDLLVTVIGAGTPTRKASAVTLGEVIVVPRRFAELPDKKRNEIIRHELQHVQQRRDYGRLYLPIYGLLYLRHGYSNHPLEQH